MTRIWIILAAMLLLVAASETVAETNFGLNLDWNKFDGSDESDWGVGARVDFGGSFRGQLSFDYYFTNAGDLFDEGDFNEDDLNLDFWEFNGNLLYAFPAGSVRPYVGGGIGIARRSLDVANVFSDDRTELGFNLLGGLRFGGGGAEPFIELRGTFYGEGDEDILGGDFGEAIQFPDRIVISGGILF